MPHTEPFEFLDVALPPDGDLKLILAERVPVEKSTWRVPAYMFRIQDPEGRYLGHIRLQVGWNEDVIRFAGQVRKKMCFSLRLR